MILKKMFFKMPLLLGAAMLLLAGCAKDTPLSEDGLMNTSVDSGMELSAADAANGDDVAADVPVIDDDIVDILERDIFGNAGENPNVIVVDGYEMAELGMRAIVGEFDSQMFPEGSSELWEYLYYCVQGYGTEELEIGHCYGGDKDSSVSGGAMPVVFNVAASDKNEKDWLFYQVLTEFVDVGEEDFLDTVLIDGAYDIADRGLPEDYDVREFEIAWVIRDENNQPKAYSVSHTASLGDEIGFDIACTGADSGTIVLNRYLAQTGKMDLMILNTLASAFGPDEAGVVALDSPLSYADFSFEKVAEIMK